MLDIDTAIKHCLKVAEQNDTQAEKWREEGGEEWGKTTACRECAADHRQLAEWLRELKDLREEYAYISKVSYGYYKELKEAKRILQLAWDDIQTLNDVTVDDEGNCLIEDKFESCTECPLFCESKRYCGWQYQVDALMLIGETNDEP